MRRRVKRGNGELESSDDDDDERTVELSDDDKPSKKQKIESTKTRKSSRLKKKRPKRRVLIGPAESDDEANSSAKPAATMGLSMASAPKYTKKGTLDMEPVVLLTSLKMGSRMSCNLAEFLKEEADEKPSDSSDSESGEDDLKERDTTLRHIASSDESDVDLAVAKRKRKAKIESDEETTQEKVEETNPWLKKSKLSIPQDSDSDTDSSFDLPPLRPAVTPKKEATKKDIKEEAKTETENTDYSTSSDDDGDQSGSSGSASSGSDSDTDRPPKPSILSQLAPGLLSQLRNDNTLLLDTFHRVFKLFIRDNLNSKSIDNCYNVDLESDDHDATRKAIDILNRSTYLVKWSASS